MVVKMMKWRPWPPIVTRKYEVKLVVRRVEGWDLVREGETERDGRLTVEIRWKGPKVKLGSLRKTVKRNFTKEAEIGVGENGVVSWDDEEFQNLCSLTSYKESVFHPWEIGLSVFSNGLNQVPKNKVPVFGTAIMNLAEYAPSDSDQREIELSIPLTLSSGSIEPRPSLCISLSVLELKSVNDPLDAIQRAIVPVPSSPLAGETVPAEKDEVSAIKAGLRKVKIFTEYVSTRRAKKACREEGESSEGRCSARSDEGETTYPFDSDSVDDFEGESDEGKTDDASIRKSFSYGSLAYANCVGGSLYTDMRINCEDEDMVYYSNRKSDVGCLIKEESTASIYEPTFVSKRRILPWRKRKLNFRSPKAKGEPLLKKDNGEEGGDDIDYDRRQLSSDEALCVGRNKLDEDSSAHRSSFSEFGDDNFAIGRWEQKEVISRDGQMKLQAQVFLASIDQRSERAAGESACTALVAVIADWFQTNSDLMPIKSQFDSLIREGSLEWRNLCENEAYREKFPDKHFDLETVLQAKIRHLTVVPEKSFIGFFQPEGMDEDKFDFLQGAMSFDSIWDEISNVGSEDCLRNPKEPHIYIVSWNDHFFILKVEKDAYFLIDTLGERLYEGCNQAYILKFDDNTVIQKLPENDQENKVNGSEPQAVEKDAETENPQANSESSEETDKSVEGEKEIVCSGKESCKVYIKNFLAAIPIRELQDDVKKGLITSAPLHHRLQIELHYTRFFQPENEFSSPDRMVSDGAAASEAEGTIADAAAVA